MPRAATKNWRGNDYVFGANTERAGEYTTDAMVAFLRGLDTSSAGSVSRPYESSIFVFAAINNIATAISGLPARLFLQSDEPVWQHPYVDLLAQPNPEQDGEELITALLIHREIDGIAYLIEPDYAPGKPTAQREIFVASKCEMHTRERRGGLLGWDYTPVDGGRDQFLSLVHAKPLRRYHPNKRLDGLPAATVARRAIEGHYAALDLFRNSVVNGAEIGSVFSTPKDLSETQHNEAMKVIKSRYTGTRNANKPILLSGDVKLDRGSAGMKDIQWLEGMKVSATFIATAFNVPLIFVNLMDQAQYNSAPIQEKLFWTMHGLPLVRRVQRALVKFILRGDAQQFYISLDTSGVQVLKDQEAEFVDKTFGLTKHGLSVNEINRRYDHGFEEPPWREVPLVGAGQIPMDVLVDDSRAALAAETAPEGGADSDESPSDKSAGAKASDPIIAGATRGVNLAASAVDEVRSATQQALHRKWLRSWHGLLRSTQLRMGKFLRRQGTDMKRRLKQVELPYDADGGKKAYTVRDTFDNLIDLILFDPEEENFKLATNLKPPIEDGLELGGKQVAKEVGDFDFNIDDPRLDAHLKQQAIRMKEVNASTTRRIRQVLRKGLDGGESLTELAKRIDGVMGSQDTARSFRIAQTEIHEAISAGRDVAMRQVGIEGKAWLTSGLPVRTKGNPNGIVRFAHKQAENLSRQGIALDDAFTLIDEDGDRETARYPADTTLSPGNRINCTCVSVARTLKKGKAFAHLDRVGSYTYEDLLRERREKQRGSQS